MSVKKRHISQRLIYRKSLQTFSLASCPPEILRRKGFIVAELNKMKWCLCLCGREVSASPEVKDMWQHQAWGHFREASVDG